MATRLDKDHIEPKLKKYDWDKWLDGTVWQLCRGEDWNCKQSSFVSQAYKAAYDRGLSAHVSVVNDDTVEVQASPQFERDNNTTEDDDEHHNRQVA